MRNYFAKLRENEEKGFSLVELIIVMAIMAILVGVVASQVIPYMEKSRQAKDQQQLSGIATDITSAIASSGQTAADVGTGVTIANGAITAGTGKELPDAITALGGTDTNAQAKIEEEFVSLRDTNGSMNVATIYSDIQKKLKSKAANQKGESAVAKKISDGKIYVIYDTKTSKCVVYMGSSDDITNAVAKLTVESE